VRPDGAFSSGRLFSVGVKITRIATDAPEMHVHFRKSIPLLRLQDLLLTHTALRRVSSRSAPLRREFLRDLIKSTDPLSQLGRRLHLLDVNFMKRLWLVKSTCTEPIYCTECSLCSAERSLRSNFVVG
jgi:hypothetical protein